MSVNIYDDTQGTLTRCDGNSALPCKMLVVTNVGFVFDNATMSTQLDIATLTNNVVTSSNVIAVSGTLLGGGGVFGFNSQKQNIFMTIPTNFTGTLNANLIFYYS